MLEEINLLVLCLNENMLGQNSQALLQLQVENSTIYVNGGKKAFQRNERQNNAEIGGRSGWMFVVEAYIANSYVTRHFGNR